MYICAYSQQEENCHKINYFLSYGSMQSSINGCRGCGYLSAGFLAEMIAWITDERGAGQLLIPQGANGIGLGRF